MKTSRILVTAALAVSMSGCATLFASTHDKVYIVPPPGAQFTSVSVTDNGQVVPVKEADYFLLDLPKGTVYVEVSSRDDHQLVVTDGSNVAKFATETEMAIGWFFLDLFTTGPIGIVVDAVTHAWRRPTPLILRVPGSRTAAVQKRRK